MPLADVYVPNEKELTKSLKYDAQANCVVTLICNKLLQLAANDADAVGIIDELKPHEPQRGGQARLHDCRPQLEAGTDDA